MKALAVPQSVFLALLLLIIPLSAVARFVSLFVRFVCCCCAGCFSGRGRGKGALWSVGPKSFVSLTETEIFLLFILSDQFLLRLLRSSRLFLCMNDDDDEEEDEKVFKREVDRKWKQNLVRCANQRISRDTFTIHFTIILPLNCLLLYFHYFVVLRHLKTFLLLLAFIFIIFVFSLLPILTFVGNNIYVSFIFFSIFSFKRGRKDFFKVEHRKIF